MILIRAKLLHLAFTSRIINNEVPLPIAVLANEGTEMLDGTLERRNGYLVKSHTKMMHLMPVFAGIKILHLYQKRMLIIFFIMEEKRVIQDGLN